MSTNLRICENGKYRNATKKELAAMQAIDPYECYTYEELVELFIGERYTFGAELALHRQKDTKPEEYAAYDAYCEECKLRAKNIKEGAK